jgi:hypothetical protein
MNEYQDQVTWFEVTVWDSHGKLVTISDHDTREEAESAPVPSWARNPRVVRRSGLPS